MSFTLLAFFSEIRQSMVRDGNYAVIFALVLGVFAAAFIGYLIWDAVLNRINSARRRKRRHARQAHQASPAVKDSDSGNSTP